MQLNVSYNARKKVLPKFMRYIDVVHVFWCASECAIMMTKENFNLKCATFLCLHECKAYHSRRPRVEERGRGQNSILRFEYK